MGVWRLSLQSLSVNKYYSHTLVSVSFLNIALLATIVPAVTVFIPVHMQRSLPTSGDIRGYCAVSMAEQ